MEKLSQHGLNNKMFHPQPIPVAEPVPVSDHVPFSVPIPDFFAFLTHSYSCTCSVFETITVPVPIPVPETGLLKQWWNQATNKQKSICIIGFMLKILLCF